MEKILEFLMVEPNPLDARLTEESFKLHKVTNQLSVVRDGLQAWRFLKHEGEYAAAALPDIIFVCISILWRANSEWLRNIKQDAALRHIPLVVLTAAQGEEDSLDEDLPIDLCVPKPLDFECLKTIVRSFDDLWFCIGVKGEAGAAVPT